ncbi:ATP-binding protein [Lacinutrix himadriensis]|uniref:ATP-binding protein n=1 Tax=Lacinutrix himadriensis TaxID=641549 RepID=UPI0006E446A2|nr:ATP-binding protein [Lacinutrix himadriensis]
MFRINYYICAIIMVLSCSVFSQEITTQERDTIQQNVNNLIRLAQKNIENSNYFEAQKELENALIPATTIEDNKSIGLIYSKLGKIEYIIEEPDEAIKQLTRAVATQRLSNDKINLAESYKTFGNVYVAKKDYQTALDYYKSSKNLFEQEGLDDFVAEVDLKKGQTFLALEDYEQAKLLFENAIALANRYNLKKIHSSAQINLGVVYAKLNNIDKAIEITNEGVNEAINNDFHNVISEGYLVLSDLNQETKNYKLANAYLRKHIKLSDSLLNVKRQNLNPERRFEYLLKNQTEYQKKQAADLEELQDSKNLSKLTAILSVALITILSLLTLSLYKNNRIRLKTNNMLHKKNGELILAKEKAELASKTKANFLSTVTHELRTPLYAVTGLSNMLLDENPKPEQVQHLKSLKFSGDYLLTFINDILQINKIEANKVEVEPEVFNLKKKVANVIAALNNSAIDNGIKLHFEYDKDLPENYNADQLKISQILINLIGNSIKFTKDGDIWVRVYKLNQTGKTYSIRFEIEDNGIGISKEKQEHMFESFSQGSIQINRKYGGTGLGLSIVKGLIDILKGKIYLKSELGKGSNFIFEIPLNYTDQVIEEETKKNYFKNISEIELSTIKILVVEDNKINQMITKKILNKMNLNCDIVDNGEDAVEQVKNTNYDVVLMDIHMPGISGLEATKIIRGFKKDLTIFALTAVTLEDKMHEFEEAGFDDIISKPFKQEDFEKKLYQALIKEEVAIVK